MIVVETLVTSGLMKMGAVFATKSFGNRAAIAFVLKSDAVPLKRNTAVAWSVAKSGPWMRIHVPLWTDVKARPHLASRTMAKAQPVIELGSAKGAARMPDAPFKFPPTASSMMRPMPYGSVAQAPSKIGGIATTMSNLRSAGPAVRHFVKI